MTTSALNRMPQDNNKNNSIARPTRLTLVTHLKAWPNACNISTQHLATSLHDVATCVEWTGQTHATYRNRVAKRTQHVVPNNVARCWVEMLRAFGQAFTLVTHLARSLFISSPHESSHTPLNKFCALLLFRWMAVLMV